MLRSDNADCRNRLYRSVMDLVERHGELSLDDKVFVLSLCRHKVAECKTKK